MTKRSCGPAAQHDVRAHEKLGGYSTARRFLDRRLRLCWLVVSRICTVAVARRCIRATACSHRRRFAKTVVGISLVSHRIVSERLVDRHRNSRSCFGLAVPRCAVLRYLSCPRRAVTDGLSVRQYRGQTTL